MVEDTFELFEEELIIDSQLGLLWVLQQTAESGKEETDEIMDEWMCNVQELIDDPTGYAERMQDLNRKL